MFDYPAKQWFLLQGLQVGHVSVATREVKINILENSYHAMG